MIINYPMIRRAVEKTTIMRRHVRQVAQGIKPSEYTEFDQKLAKSIEEESGKYSKNPIKKITSWVKETSAQMMQNPQVAKEMEIKRKKLEEGEKMLMI